MTEVKEGGVSFFGLAARQIEDAKPFYAELFGWTIEQPNPRYPARIEGAGIPGFAHSTDQLTRFLVYFRVTDIAAAAQRVKELGGSISATTANIPGMGKLLNCSDNQGVEFGLHEPER